MRDAYGVPRSFFGLVPGRLTFVIARDGTIRSILGHQIRMRTHVAAARDAVEQLVTTSPVLINS